MSWEDPLLLTLTDFEGHIFPSDNDDCRSPTMPSSSTSESLPDGWRRVPRRRHGADRRRASPSRASFDRVLREPPSLGAREWRPWRLFLGF